MKIDSIEVFHVALPLRQPQQTSHRSFETLETVLLRMQSGQTVGWGEAAPGNGPLGHADWTAGVFGCLSDWLAPAIQGQSIDTADEIAEQLKPFQGNRFAKAALDTAWWDLNARRQEKPLHELLGGKRQAVELGTTLDRMETIDELIEAVGRAFQDGFARVKLMFRPGWDIQMVDFVRKEFPVEMLHIDCDADLGLQHMEMLCRLDDFHLEMIEQPFATDDLVGHAMAGDTINTPIGLGRSITTPDQAEVAIELQSCQFMNLEPGRVGGLTSAVAIHEACRSAKVTCWAGAMPQSALGSRIGLALASLENCTYPADYFDSGAMLQEDLAEPLLPVRDETDGKLRVSLWSEPGLGIEPDPEQLDRFCTARAKIG